MSPPRRPRAETQADNDARLLDAARRVFVEVGFHAASLDQITRAAGLTKGAVYARFSSKAELLLALLEIHVELRIEELRAAVADAEGPDEAARRAARQWVERSAQAEGWALLLLEFRVFAARHPEVGARYAELHARLVAEVAAIYTRAYARAGRVPHVEAETWAIWALALGNGFVLERAARRGSEPRGRVGAGAARDADGLGDAFVALAVAQVRP